MITYFVINVFMDGMSERAAVVKVFVN